MQTIAYAPARQIVEQIRGAKIAGFTTATVRKMKKTANPFHGKVVSVKNIVGMFNFDYQGNVGNARERAGMSREDWNKGESWHKPIIDEQGRMTPFCQHKTTGELYFRVRVLKYVRSKFYASERIVHEGYAYEPGDEIPRSVLEPFFYASNSYANQGLDKGKEIEIVTLKLDSLRGFRDKGYSYLIDPAGEPNPAIEQRVEEMIGWLDN